MDEFFNCYKFSNIPIEQAIRLFVLDCRLNGEGQVIDRCLKSFCTKYFKDNPSSLFGSEKNILTFAYSLIILQTDLHNPSIKQHIEQKEFVNSLLMLKDCQITTEYMESLYNNIKGESLESIENRDEIMKKFSRYIWVNQNLEEIQCNFENCQIALLRTVCIKLNNRKKLEIAHIFLEKLIKSFITFLERLIEIEFIYKLSEEENSNLISIILLSLKFVNLISSNLSQKFIVK